jgi:hypothetical protein
LALFCGFANCKLDDAPDVMNIKVKEYTNLAANSYTINNNSGSSSSNGDYGDNANGNNGNNAHGGNSNQKENVGDDDDDDDNWLTSSFFISLSKEKVDAMRDVAASKYDPLVGLLRGRAQSLSSVRLAEDLLGIGAGANQGAEGQIDEVRMHVLLYIIRCFSTSQLSEIYNISIYSP